MGQTLSGQERQYRFERKYYLNRFEAEILRGRISSVLHPDEHSQGRDTGYRISSLYFDDIYNTALFQKQNGVLLRNKLRMRYYNGNLDFIRLELKHKYGEMVSKENVPVSAAQYAMLREDNYDFAFYEQHPLWRMFYMRRVTVGLRPVVMVEYTRKAFTYTPGNVRITFDMNLCASLPWFGTSLTVLPDDCVILEVKYDNFLPSVVSSLLAAARLTQVAISKYVLCREKLSGALLLT